MIALTISLSLPGEAVKIKPQIDFYHWCSCENVQRFTAGTLSSLLDESESYGGWLQYKPDKS